MIAQFKTYTYEEFLELDNKTEEFLEYIDGQIFNQASPSTMHQTVSMNLSVEFKLYFKNKQCKVFHAPFDIILKNDKEQHTNKVIPDISVICDKRGLNDKNYIGVPNLIVEILSSSNQAHDLITKMNLYQRFGVKEYWIVNPKLKFVQIYSLNKDGMYEQAGAYKGEDVIFSDAFNDLNIDIKDVFE